MEEIKQKMFRIVMILGEIEKKKNQTRLLGLCVSWCVLGWWAVWYQQNLTTSP